MINYPAHTSYDQCKVVFLQTHSTDEKELMDAGVLHILKGKILCKNRRKIFWFEVDLLTSIFAKEALRASKQMDYI